MSFYDISLGDGVPRVSGAGGYFRLARRQFRPGDGGGCPLWNEPREFSRWEAWIDLIQLAAWRSYELVVGARAITIHRGETRPLSLRFLALRWGWGAKRTRLYLELLSEMGRIGARQETRVGHTYMIVNYDTYQSEGHAEGTPRGTDGARTGHSEGTKKKEVEEGEGRKKNQKARTRRDREPVEIPPKITDRMPDFPGLWSERLTAAKEKGRLPPPTGERAQLARLAVVIEQPGGAEWIRERIADATASGWQSVFPHGMPRGPGEETGNTRGRNGAGPRHLGGSRHVVPSEMSDEQRRLTEEAQRKIDSGEWRLE